jgi:D-alanyl-D-alanine carboxypeptidase/D-alanyl-D-alanine-endopeptidase (penicillin-binding protein 4)
MKPTALSRSGFAGLPHPICLVVLLACWLAGAVQAASLPTPVAQALKTAGIPQSAVAVVVQAVDARRPRLALHAAVAMNPASTMKLLTTFAALDMLGPAYTWQTEAYTSGTLTDGVLTGDVHLRGSGDPALTYERFGRLLRELRSRGLRDIYGDLVLDRSAFAVEATDPGQFDNAPTRPYNVTPDALLLNFNALSLQLIPAGTTGPPTVLIEPPLANLDLVNQIRPDAGGPCDGDWQDALRADSFAHGASLRLVLSGSYPSSCGERRWHTAPTDHSLFVLGVFRQLWAELGGSFSGAVRDGPVPPDARLLAVLPSPTLGEVVRDINKYSNNVMARQLFLTLGLAAGHRPATTEDSVTAVQAWLAKRGLTLPGLVLENGSGLSRSERISAADLSRLLLAAWRSAVMPELMSSLPIAANDGTMKKRLLQNGVAGQAHIKTGSLDGVSAIAGYVLDKRGRRWVVVCLVNHPNAAAAHPAMDALLQWVWAAKN